jgi:hypothetical protein
MKINQVFAIIVVCFSMTVQAQELKVKCDAYTDKGLADDITLTITQLGGEGVPNVLKQVGKHKLYFAAGEEYMLTYEKEGYVTKTIHLVTPERLESKKTIEFDVLLLPQPTEQGELTYTAPVGFIYFTGANTMKYKKDYKFVVNENVIMATK